MNRNVVCGSDQVVDVSPSLRRCAAVTGDQVVDISPSLRRCDISLKLKTLVFLPK